MRIARSLAAVGLVLTALLPARGSSSELDATVVLVDDDTAIVSIQNPNPGAETARIQVAVRYTDNSTQTIVSDVFTIDGNLTTPVVVTGAKTIASIIDDPEPISP